jgi:hypothetical protein
MPWSIGGVIMKVKAAILGELPVPVLVGLIKMPRMYLYIGGGVCMIVWFYDCPLLAPVLWRLISPVFEDRRIY